MSGLTQKRAGILLAAGMVVLAVIFLSSYITFRSYFHSSDLRKHSFLRMNVLQELLSKVTEAETGQRGYLLTGKDAYLKPFESAKSDIPGLVAELRRLTDSGQPSGMEDRLEQQIKIKLDELELTVNLRRSRGMEAALRVVETDAGKNAMDDIRQISKVMIDEETALVNANDAAMTQGTKRAAIILVAGTALTITLVLGAGLIAHLAMKEREGAEANLIASVRQLTMSNRDLEQFAYVASHDLQEPLRMVSNYCRLLGRRYKGRLDSDADEFIDFAVDGAQRMQKLIDDLLAYSRVGSRRGEAIGASVADSFDAAVKNLGASISESGAVITHEMWPELMVDPVQLTQLFQNLLGNAIKFKGEKPPRIHVSVQEKETEWLFGVRDEGIGIAPEYYEQIFVIFQRLNSKKEYPGTGIGLAVCKKIVETHGGRIWLESKVDAGTTFYFTFPRPVATSNRRIT